jgi:hypothetical protein
MNRTACFLLTMLAWSLLTGCIASLPEKAKLLAAHQECGGAANIVQNTELATRYSQCVESQLNAINAQEVAYERRQADFLVELSKALEPSDRYTRR